MAATIADLRAALELAGQGHLGAHAASLPEDRERAFLEEAAAEPWSDLGAALEGDAPGAGAPELRPPQVLTFSRQAGEPELVKRLAALGQALLAGGRVATLLLAGGQGTRLGHAGPKGDVVFGPEEDRTLYRIHAERVAAASRRAGRPLPLFVLTSPQTEGATRAAFADPGRWGLAEGQVRFLVQGTLPCLDSEGRALVAEPGVLARAPDGHGGAFHALAEAGVLEELAEAGVDALTTFQVDNPLARPLDPVMLGWMVERRLRAVGKAVRKSSVDERVGVFARDLRGRLRVVEYSELPESAPGQHGEAVEAPLVMGSIAVHGFSVRFLREVAASTSGLPLHRARKAVPHLDAAGVRVEPVEPNAWKLERFLFDLFAHADRAEVHEVRREWEFAPVKNATGSDSLVAARVLVESEVRRWHRERGRAEPESASLRPLEMDGPTD